MIVLVVNDFSVALFKFKRHAPIAVDLNTPMLLQISARVLADEAETTQIYAWDDSLAAATSGQRASKSGFLNALFTIIEESHRWPHYGMPKSFYLTNQAWATLTNSLLNLCDDQMATEDSVKSSIRNFKKSK